MRRGENSVSRDHRLFYEKNQFILEKIMQNHHIKQKWYIVLSIGVFFFTTGFIFSILDNIDVVAIPEMQVRQNGDQYILDAVVTLRNSSQKTLKLIQSDFHLAFVGRDAENIELGNVHHNEILLAQEGDAKQTDTDVIFSIPLGSKKDLHALYEKLIASTELLLLEPKPKINLHLQARFDFAIKSLQAWNYGNGIQIDWIVTPEVEQSVLLKFLEAISSEKPVTPTVLPSPTSVRSMAPAD